jgi:hypothetical protein
MVDPRAGPGGHCAIRLAPLHCELLVIAKYHGVRMSSLQLVRVSLTSTPPPNLAPLPRSFPVRDRDVNSLVSNPSGNAYWVLFNWCTRHLPGRIFRCTRYQKLGVFHTFPAMALKGASYTFPKGVAYTGPSNHSEMRSKHTNPALVPPAACKQTLVVVGGGWDLRESLPKL